MISEYHVPTRAHVRGCAECRKRLEFMDRLQVETVVIGEELKLIPYQAICLLVTLACTMADSNDCLEELAEHMSASIDMVADRIDSRS